MSRQYWSETLAVATGAGTALANSVVETTLVSNFVVPANFMQDGRLVRMRAFGAYGTTGTPALTMALRWGGVTGTVIAKTGASVLTSAVGGGASMTATWSLEAYLQTRSNGATGTIFSMGEVVFYTSTLGTAGTVTNYGMPVPLVSGATGGSTPVVATCDFTADQPLALTGLWGTANAANSIQLTMFSFEAMN